MGITFVIVDSAATKTFAALADTAGRKALSIRKASPEYAIDRFHVPGVDGNYLMRKGKTGQTVICRMRYIGAGIAAADALYDADRLLWANETVTVDGISRCSLQPGGMSKITDPRPVGDGSLVWYDVQAIFTVDS